MPDFGSTLLTSVVTIGLADVFMLYGAKSPQQHKLAFPVNSTVLASKIFILALQIFLATTQFFKSEIKKRALSNFQVSTPNSKNIPKFSAQINFPVQKIYQNPTNINQLRNLYPPDSYHLFRVMSSIQVRRDIN
jgi:hypothetical protein